jgi:CheY-like chemotaxis protein
MKIENTFHPAEETVHHEAEPKRRGRILVIEDDPILLLILAKALSSRHDVVATGSAKEALTRLLGDERYDLVLCDLMMPEMTGIELYLSLESERPDLICRLVFLTGGAFTPDAQAFLQRIPNRRLRKPVALSRLVAIVTDIIME